jgi:hypothetical protein
MTQCVFPAHFDLISFWGYRARYGGSPTDWAARGRGRQEHERHDRRLDSLPERGEDGQQSSGSWRMTFSDHPVAQRENGLDAGDTDITSFWYNPLYSLVRAGLDGECDGRIAYERD